MLTEYFQVWRLLPSYKGMNKFIFYIYDFNKLVIAAQLQIYDIFVLIIHILKVCKQVVKVNVMSAVVLQTMQNKGSLQKNNGK